MMREKTNNSQHTQQNQQRSSVLQYASHYTSEHHNYEGTGQFIPPQHKYINLQKYKSPYFTDNNEEEYVIQRAFQANNFTYLRNLPDSFNRNCILEDRKDRVKGQILDETILRSRMPIEVEATRKAKIDEIKRAKIGSLGYFEVFPYQESDYQIPKKKAIEERIQKDEKRKLISDLEFRPMGFDKKNKYEDPFRYIDRLDSTTAIMDMTDKQKYLFPFHLPGDMYNAFHQDQKRRKIIQKELTLAGNFMPSGKQYSLNQVSKAKMPQILNEIEYYFKKFLKNNYGYFIGVNKRDHIQIMFQAKFVDDPKLQMAMSGMLEHQILCRFVLRKYFQRWGVVNQKTQYLQFVILPPWVKDQEEKLRAPTAPTAYTSQTKRKQQ